MKDDILRDYRYIDEIKLNSLAQQFGFSETELEQGSSKFGLSLAGPRFETSRDTNTRPSNAHENITNLIEHLENKGWLGRTRPDRMPQYMNGEATKKPEIPKFILERCRATKVILPRDKMSSIPNLEGLAVWVSDPSDGFQKKRDDEWDFVGTFLLLTHLAWSNDKFQTVFSGCSALQAVWNGANGHAPLSYHPNSGEPLGRSNTDHPLVKLENIGGIVSQSKEIECLYRPQYMSNEQRCELDGKEHRLNDLMAYPIFIAELI